MQYIFICTGNLCRSAFAEAYCHHHYPHIPVTSMGTAGLQDKKARPKLTRQHNGLEHPLQHIDHAPSPPKFLPRQNGSSVWNGSIQSISISTILGYTNEPFSYAALGAQASDERFKTPMENLPECIDGCFPLLPGR